LKNNKGFHTTKITRQNEEDKIELENNLMEYEKMLKKGPSPSILYNMAILNFQLG